MIIPLTPDIFDSCASLFAAYPYKRAQQKVQRLDRERLNAFYFAGLRQSVERGAPHWVALDAERQPIALAGLASESWHGEIYGLRMGKLQPWLNTVAPEHADALLEAALAEARARGLQHLSVRVDGEDFPNLQRLQARGFYLVDVSLKFSRALPLTECLDVPGAAGELTIREATTEDHGWIRQLGSTTHGGTHFLNDPNLSTERTRALFAAWIDRCLNGLAYKTYVLRSGDGAGMGFVTYLRAGAFSRAVGANPLILDFVLIAPDVRGGGLGPWFIAETLERERVAQFDYCELRTSAHNLAAVINYEKLGFRCCASDFVLHLLLRP